MVICYFFMYHLKKTKTKHNKIRNDSLSPSLFNPKHDSLLALSLQWSSISLLHHSLLEIFYHLHSHRRSFRLSRGLLSRSFMAVFPKIRVWSGLQWNRLKELWFKIIFVFWVFWIDFKKKINTIFYFRWVSGSSFEFSPLKNTILFGLDLIVFTFFVRFFLLIIYFIFCLIFSFLWCSLSFCFMFYFLFIFWFL